ncbi:uncharacterized protein BP01DRAFT_382761 [Aspergillus saccharolyticus JOP 1030-1]|uniref:Uncharacterized protein n=1 Tax=Aspergillus saccharolyticus JOP 1030-1 TaxID=1450539 RepID=A0A318ZZ00_9EURO|nr:hypothetical protein BP01DRAFT_382761 [Aspergillus saccharolyticus JOP 1030-1]PYH45318.1 hypothetical protein BP01DRAFT_382761 [Aspergillus saccharolyticus JOP 1030-1]
MSYTLKKSQTHCVMLDAHSADPREAVPQPRATMATVSMTSELEPYLASLRSYLAQSSPTPPAETDSEDNVSDITRPHGRRTLQRERTSAKEKGDDSRPGSRGSVAENPPFQVC